MAISLIDDTSGSYYSHIALATSGSLPAFSFDPGIGDFVIVAVGGWRSANATMTFAPTIDGAAMTPVGTVQYAGNSSVQSAFFQWFIKTGVTPGVKNFAGTWSSSSNCAPRLRMGALSYDGVGSYGGLVDGGNSGAGTDFFQIFDTSNGHMIVHCYAQQIQNEPSNYLPTPIIDAFDGGSDFQGIIGQGLASGPTVTMRCTKQTLVYYLYSGFDLTPAVAGGAVTGTIVASKRKAMANIASSAPAQSPSGMIMVI